MRSLLMVALLVSHATAETVKQPACGPAKTAPATPRTVRDVDWCNTPIAGTPLRAGRNELHEYEKLGAPHDTIIHRLRGVVYGDLDGDGRLEAAVVVERLVSFASSNKSTVQTRVHIFGLASGAHASYGSIDANGDVSALSLGDGIVAVTTGKVTTRYRRDKDAFVEVKAK